MSKLLNAIWTEKYRPTSIKDIILSTDIKNSLLKYIQKPLEMPSFIFASASPGTGKTSLAKLLEKELDADFLRLNASDDRGIDNIREIKKFVMSFSTNPDVKRCVFLDEADGLTYQAQDAMKVLMEEHSKNCFFILSCNDISKISDPIKSRCIVYNFQEPPKDQILTLLTDIVKKENIPGVTEGNLNEIIGVYYPDIRYMIKELQSISVSGSSKTIVAKTEFQEVMKAINKKDMMFVYNKVYSEGLDIHGFNRYFFQCLYKTEKMPPEKRAKIAMHLAEIEISWEIKSNAEIVFLAHIDQIMQII